MPNQITTETLHVGAPPLDEKTFLNACIKSLKWDTCITIYWDSKRKDFITVPSRRVEPPNIPYCDDFEFIKKTMVF